MHTNVLNLRRRGDGVPLLLIHGVAGSGIIFDQVLDCMRPGFEALRVWMGVALALEYAARYPHATRAVVGLGLPYYRDDAEARESMMATYHAFSSTVVECLVRNRTEPLFDRTREIPMTFVHGGDDRWCPPERVEALVADRANCTFRRIAGAGHNVAVIDPATTAGLASEFLASLL